MLSSLLINRQRPQREPWWGLIVLLCFEHVESSSVTLTTLLCNTQQCSRTSASTSTSTSATMNIYQSHEQGERKQFIPGRKQTGDFSSQTGQSCWNDTPTTEREQFYLCAHAERECGGNNFLGKGMWLGVGLVTNLWWRFSHSVHLVVVRQRSWILPHGKFPEKDHAVTTTKRQILQRVVAW